MGPISVIECKRFRVLTMLICVVAYKFASGASAPLVFFASGEGRRGGVVLDVAAFCVVNIIVIRFRERGIS